VVIRGKSSGLPLENIMRRYFEACCIFFEGNICGRIRLLEKSPLFDSNIRLE